MTAHVETYDLPYDGTHARAQLVALPVESEVVDAYMDPAGAVVLTVTSVRSLTKTEQVVYLLGERGTPGPGARFVRTVFHHELGLVLHVYIAPDDEHTRRDVQHATRH